jgi:membrane-associated phospholipid phosphatase
MTDDPKFREISYEIGQSLVMGAIILYPLKIVTSRERPNREDQRSFPSGHATSAFAVAAVLDHYYGWKVSIPVYATGAFIAFGRMEQNKHFLTDVVAGATLGWIIGKTVTRGADDKPRWVPTVSPQAQGIALGININLDK